MMSGFWVKQVGRQATHCLDYLDDAVRSRKISVCSLIAVTGPLMHWMYRVYNTFSNPLLIFVLYIVISAVSCVLILTPLQLGNAILQPSVPQSSIQLSSKSLSNHLVTRVVISCVTCVLLASYELYAFLSSIDSIYDRWQSWIYAFSMLISAFAALFAICCYVSSFSEPIFALTKRAMLTLVYRSIDNYFRTFQTRGFLELSPAVVHKNEESESDLIAPPSDMDADSLESDFDENMNSSVAHIQKKSMHHRDSVLSAPVDVDTATYIYDPERELFRGYKHLIKEFLWPTVMDEEDDKDNQHPDTLKNVRKIVYPSRLFAAVYIGVLGMIAVFQMELCWGGQIEDIMHTLQKYTTLLENMTIDTSMISMIDDSDTDAAKQWAVSISRSIHRFLKSVSIGLYAGSVIGFVSGLYACILVFRAYKKKIVEMRKKSPTYRYHPSFFPVWWTTRLISTLASYLITGTVLVGWFFAFVIGLLGWGQFWDFVGGYKMYIITYALYYLLDLVFIRRILLARVFTNDKGSIDPKYEHWFQFLLPILDILYLPLALLFGLFRILTWTIFALCSYIRPDLNMYPRGLEDWDYGHLTFVSTVRLTVEREPKFLEKNGGMSTRLDEKYVGLMNEHPLQSDAQL